MLGYADGITNLEQVYTKSICGMGNDTKYKDAGYSKNCVSYVKDDYYGKLDGSAIYKII